LFSCPCARFVEQKSSSLAAALGVSKFMSITAINLVTLCCAAQGPTWMIIKPASDIPTQRGINLFFSDCSAGKSPSFAGVPARSEELPDR